MLLLLRCSHVAPGIRTNPAVWTAGGIPADPASRRIDFQVPRDGAAAGSAGAASYDHRCLKLAPPLRPSPTPAAPLAATFPDDEPIFAECQCRMPVPWLRLLNPAGAGRLTTRCRRIARKRHRLSRRQLRWIGTANFGGRKSASAGASDCCRRTLREICRKRWKKRW